MGRWGDGEMGRWGDGEMGRWGDGANFPSLSIVLREGNSAASHELVHQQRIKSYYYSRFPIPDSRFPIPDSLPLQINSKLGAKSEYCARIYKLKQTSSLDIPRLRC